MSTPVDALVSAAALSNGNGAAAPVPVPMSPYEQAVALKYRAAALSDEEKQTDLLSVLCTEFQRLAAQCSPSDEDRLLLDGRFIFKYRMETARKNVEEVRKASADIADVRFSLVEGDL